MVSDTKYDVVSLHCSVFEGEKVTGMQLTNQGETYVAPVPYDLSPGQVPFAWHWGPGPMFRSKDRRQQERDVYLFTRGWDRWDRWD